MRMLKYYVISFVIVSVLISSNALALDETSTTELIDKSELSIYGETFEKGLIYRIENIEKNLFGKSSKGSVLKRAEIIDESLYNCSEKNNALETLVNFMEWRLWENLENDGFINRVPRIEKLLFGKELTGPISNRVQSILKNSLLGKPLHIQKVVLSEGTLIKLKTLDTISSRNAQMEDSFQFQVVDNIVISNCLVIPKGIKGICKIFKIKRAKKFGRNGKITLEFQSIKSIDGQNVGLAINAQAIENNKQAGIAASASIVGVAALGPLGLLSGLFINGEDVTIPEETEIYAAVKEPVNVKAVFLPALED
ncbi:MAG: hypothetical protein JXR91_06390 [Deltaproteobacteria bacterium]|nr:hypothetical protein [Deltaproteobacteria bacterium]